MKSVVYGAGNIGRGFIGKLMYESGYEVVFIDVNKSVVEQLNMRRSYPVNVVSNVSNIEETVKNVRAVLATDKGSVAKEIAGAQLMATAVGASMLPIIAPNIAKGIELRMLKKREPLNILICENQINAGNNLKRYVCENLPHSLQSKLGSAAGFVETSIGRMVPNMTDEMKMGDPLRIWAEPYCELPVDGSAFIGSVPKLKNLIPFSPFEYYIECKLYIHNLGHAACAYIGYLKGYKYIWECVADKEIRGYARAAMLESAAALSKKFDIPVTEITGYADGLLERFGNKALGDTVIRVGRDPLRKLKPNDRIAGAINLCKNEGKEYGNILFVLAAALLFKQPEDESSVEMSRLLGGYPADFLKNWCELDSDTADECIKVYESLKASETFN